MQEEDYFYGVRGGIRFSNTCAQIKSSTSSPMPSPFKKALLDAPTATLLEAGFIERDLSNTTPEGYCALAAILIAANKDAYVAAAQAVIDARKASK